MAFCFAILKATNILVSKELGEYKREKYLSSMSILRDVVDFESLEGLMKTRFWKALEVLRALQNQKNPLI